MKENICILENITGRAYTNAHMTNSDMSDTIVNATCQYYSGTITLDMSDQRLIFFSPHGKKSKQCQLWQLHDELHTN